MRLARKDRWQDDFWNAMQIVANEPFSWGSSDCVLKAARVADSMLVDPILEERARKSFAWSDQATAISTLEAAGGLRSAVESVLGIAVDWRKLTHGDLVLCRSGFEHSGVDLCIAIHDGVNPIAFVDGSMRPLPWRLAECGWEV